MAEKKVPQLELFYRPTCPYCVKVLTWMKNEGVDNVTLYDISSDSEAVKRLVAEGGKKQVPCLFVDGQPMYESNDIIAFLDKLRHEPFDDIAR
ncbi:glutaredoxin [Olsenella sp. YH-ols2217]|uniref:Glutaredoxin n=1 Tax=Kribbibacterium absianum TaxID=3044210 RepID=A0ABT6ZJI1_9ACTN|nr:MULTISPECIES: glutaredoxin [unclassified Olsenella]MDJ1122812.1 glutaredoxin [Olsenella sp. YH-ols2216]MDJ1129205.1 glutaredoxin [Olsenella sp. YH-ols2217]